MLSFYKKILISSLILLTSCLSLSKQELTQNVLELPSVTKTAEEGLKSHVFEEGSWPDKEWWKIFEEEELSALIDQALTNNPSILAIERRVELARQNAKVVRSNLFPLLYFNYNESWDHLSKNGLYRALNNNIPLAANQIDLSLSFNYEFDFWSKNLNLFRTAIGKTKADEAEAAEVELITTTAVAQAYFALKTNMLKSSLLKELTEVQNKIFDLQMLMKEKAIFSKLVPLRGEEDLEETKKRLISIQEEVEIDRHLVNILVGRGPDAELNIDASLATLPRTITLPSTLSLDLLARRPDLMAQIWRVEALSHEVAVAKADFYPNINLVGLAGLESLSFAKLFRAQSETAGLKPAINLPIFTAGSIKANVRAKKAAFDQAVFEYNQKLLDSTKEVADLIVFAQSIYEQKYLQQNIVEEALELYELISLRHAEGLDNLLSLYASRLRLIEKQLGDVDLLYNQYLASIKLIKSLGGGYISEYLPIKSGARESDGTK